MFFPVCLPLPGAQAVINDINEINEINDINDINEIADF